VRHFGGAASGCTQQILLLRVFPAKKAGDEAQPAVRIGLHNIGWGAPSVAGSGYTLDCHKWGDAHLHTVPRCQFLQRECCSPHGVGDELVTGVRTGG